MPTLSELSRIELLADLTDDELEWISAHTQEELVPAGSYFVREGEPADRFYIVLAGELQIIRTIDGKELVMGTTPHGIMGGEIALLNGIPANITARALMDSRLLVFRTAAFRQMFAAVPPLGTKVLRIAAERMQSYASRVQQQERLAAVGKLSAGLAHELNNPAAAAQRAARTLSETLAGLQTRTLALNQLGLNSEQITQLAAYQAQLSARQQSLPPLSTIEQADREDELADWLSDHQVPAAYEIAAGLVAAGVTPAELRKLTQHIPAPIFGTILGWLSESVNADGLLHEIELATRRISELVGAVKQYTYMDQGHEHDVNINRDLENTLTVLNHKLKRGVTVIREYDPALPAVVGNGGELNQVWTNLIANAIEAMEYQGTLKVITRCEHDFVMVEITDTGPGIPDAIQPRIFDPFFTTKPVGAGTGLGLDITYRVIRQHNGSIDVQSQPGNTRFIVRLPAAQGG
jgi:signal transduction histidine kinase